jgi:hypothetical protein
MSAASLAILITCTGSRVDDAGIFAAWNDGTLVWSDDRLHGGPPYRIADIDPADIAAAVAQMTSAARRLDEWHFAPDARWIRITVHNGTERVIDAGSSHEIIEEVPHLVATATGGEPLSGQSAAEVLARQPPHYRAFRAWWDAAKNAAFGLIPAVSRRAGPADATHIPW